MDQFSGIKYLYLELTNACSSMIFSKCQINWLKAPSNLRITMCDVKTIGIFL